MFAIEVYKQQVEIYNLREGGRRGEREKERERERERERSKED